VSEHFVDEHSVEEHYVQVSGLNLRYQTRGSSGPVLVLLHGIGRSLEDWESSSGPLSQNHRVYALDLPGFGRSDKPQSGYSFAYFAGVLEGFLDALQLEQVTLLGSSLGGGVALEFAFAHPERVSRLVLVDSAGFGSEVTLGLRILTLRGVGELLSTPSPRLVRGTLEGVFFDKGFITPEREARELELARLKGAQSAYVSVARALGTFLGGVRAEWVWSVLRRCGDLTHLPTLIVWGDRDQILPPKHARVAQAHLPHAELHIFEGCGHFPQLERAEEFNALVLEFLSRHPPEHTRERLEGVTA